MDSATPVGQETFKEQVVDIGITDGVWTVLKSDQLAPGVEVIVEQRDAKQDKGFKLF